MRFLSLFLCSLIALNPIWAQSNPSVPAEPALDAPLHVHPVDGQSSKGYLFQVTDGAGSPVPGAAVALRLPEAPTGSFANGLRSSVAYSDAAGIVSFPLIEWGQGAGQVQLKVSAAKGASHAALLIAQEVGVDKPSVRVVSVPVPAPLTDTVPATTSHTLRPNPPPPLKEASSEPAVMITNTTTGAGGSASQKKVWLAVGIGAGAAVAALLAVIASHGAGAAGGSNSGVTIGAPTITVGH